MDAVLFLIVIEAIGLLTYPLASKIFGPMNGYSVSKQFGLALLATISLVLSCLLSISPHSPHSPSYPLFPICARLSAVLLSLPLISAILLTTMKGEKGLEKPVSVRSIVFLELVFVASYALFLAYIAHKPQIYFAYSEDFMDFAILKAILKSGIPYDPWFAGESLHYYFFGHLIAAALIGVSGVKAEIGYNLAIAAFYSMAVQTAFGLGLSLTGRKLYGALTALLTCFTGFISGFLQLLAYLTSRQILNYRPEHWLTHFNFFAANWVIPHTLVFYPFFTFLQVDLHAHYMAIPFQLALITACLSLYRRFDARTAVATLFLLAFSAGVNVWDLPSYFLLFIATLYLSTRDRRVIAAGFALTAIAFALFLWKGMIGLVSERTSLAAFLQIFAVFLFPTLVYSAKTKRYFLLGLIATLFAGFLAGVQVLFLAAILVALVFRTNSDRYPELLAAVAITLILFCEFLHIKDAMGRPYERMNTVMKLYLDAWVLWGVSAACFVRKSGRKATALFLILVALSMIHPISTIASMPNNPLMGRTRGLTLDGMKWLEESMPSEYRAIKWLDNKSGVVLEAPGIPYTYSSRVSAFTGLPTVIGWETHEVMWGRSWKEVEERVKDVNSIYTNGSRALVEKYGVKYIFVGRVERERYHSIGLRNCSWLRVAYRDGGVVVYEVAG